MVLYVVDLETTGIYGYPRDKILEIALARISDDLKKELVYDTLISYPDRYKDKINRCWWARQCGIGFDDLKDSPSMEEVWKDLRRILKGKNLTSWNVGFDLTSFLGKMESHLGSLGYRKQPCLMWQSAEYMRGIFGKKKPPKLEQAANFYQVEVGKSDYHRARYDTLIAADIAIQMMKRGHYTIR